MSLNNEAIEAEPDAVDSRLARHGHVSYLEIPAVDVKQSAEFYQAVFGWRIEPRDSEHISFDDLSGDLIGRWVSGRTIARAPGLMAYIYVDRIDEAVTRIVAHGGEIAKSPCEEGNLWVATFRDPAGNLIGIWQAGPRS
jgi:predicted enzyme related to lactoylglutathione lyase